jgi:hypothetical protein
MAQGIRAVHVGDVYKDKDARRADKEITITAVGWTYAFYGAVPTVRTGIKKERLQTRYTLVNEGEPY